MKVSKVTTSIAVMAGGALLRDALVARIEQTVAIEAKRLEVPYWLALTAVGGAIILLAD